MSGADLPSSSVAAMAGKISMGAKREITSALAARRRSQRLWVDAEAKDRVGSSLMLNRTSDGV